MNIAKQIDHEHAENLLNEFVKKPENFQEKAKINTILFCQFRTNDYLCTR